MSKLSVVIITLNEEKNIGSCIDSVHEIADEIILLDSFSTDSTIAIAKTKGAKVFQQKFEGYTAQKNKAITYASNDYVLALDADELLSPELLNSIKQIKRAGYSADAYTMNRLNYFADKPIKTCGWYPD